MLLLLSTTHRPATDLGFLLHKNPSRLHVSEMSFGRVNVFYPEVTEERCTAALMLEIDPVRLVRGRSGPNGEGGLFNHYVNDRPYAASSFISSAISEMYSTAMGGRSKERQEVADQPIDLEAHLPVLPCRGGEAFLRSLFEPLGYKIEATQLPLDEKFVEWGESVYFALTLKGTVRLCDLLSHLYVLIPVLDNEKHYWVDKQEIEKLLRRGESWLPSHPEREQIARRYLRHQKHLTREALERLAEMDGLVDPDAQDEEALIAEQAIEKPLSLHDVRLSTVRDALKRSGAHRVVDLGCGEGRLLRLLLNESQFTEVLGMDVSHSQLDRAAQRLNPERLPERIAKKLKLIQGSLMYRDKRIEGFDAAAVVEVIEHLDPPRLAAFERVVFEFAKPNSVVITTPNQEYNVLFGTLREGTMRHRDHRFEWTRAEFERWGTNVAEKHGYKVDFYPVGPVDDIHGAPSQMGVFNR